MKILFLVHQFYPDHYTGTEKFLLGLAKSCQRLGHKVKVVTYSFRPDSFFDRQIGSILLKESTYQKIPIIYLKYLKYQIPSADLDFELEQSELAKVAEQILVDEKPDLLHAAHTMRLTGFVSEARKLGIPYVITLTDFFLICPKNNLITSVKSLCVGPEGGDACRQLCQELPNKAVKARLVKAGELLREAKRVFSPSKFLAAMYDKEHAGVSVRHMRHGVSYSNIRKNVRKYQKADRLTFFYGGSLTWHKGIHILVDAFRQVRGEAELKIYGSGDFEKVVRNLAIYDKRIKFCGVFSAEDLGGILSQVDAIILPSIWYENSPIMLLEALASDVPAIVTDLGGMAEAVKDGVTGRTFRLGDAAHLSEILQEIVDDPRLLNDYKENIRGNFVPSVEQEALAYQKEYQAICRNKPL